MVKTRPLTVLATEPAAGNWWRGDLVFWALYTLFWHWVASPDPFAVEALITSLLFTTVNAAAAYGNVLVLMPRLLGRGRYLLYALSLLLLVAAAAAVLGGILYGWFSLVDPETMAGIRLNPYIVLGPLLGSNATSVFTLMVIHMVRHRRSLDQRHQALEREKLRMELDYLKNQLNPHFLFNALNNIYFQIKKDPDAAAESLAGFSDLLRYQLYESDKAMVPLEREFEYIEQYVRVARLRFTDSLDLQVFLPGQADGYRIPPLLLLPLVENAFKYVRRRDGLIAIDAAVRESSLSFSVTNNYEAPALPEGESGGIGLFNLRRRLELLYPEGHHLQITRQKDLFSVHLKLTAYAALPDRR
jgi:sensor histidine kinase YesM